MSAMKKLAAIAALLFAAAAVIGEEAVLTAGNIQVEDGDTLRIFIDGREQRVQLAGIDTPEDADNPKLQRDMARTGLSRERLVALGRSATEYLRKLLETGAPHTLHYAPEKRDRYGRLSVELADTKGRSVGETLVADGYAVASRDASSNLLELQSTAQRERRGLWGLEPETTALWAGIPRQ